MLYVLHGPDRTGLKKRVRILEEQHALKSTWFSEESKPAGSGILLSSDLFSGRQMFVLDGLLRHMLTEDDLPQYLQTENVVVFVEDGLDNRTKLASILKTSPKVSLESFDVPSFHDLENWIKAEAKEMQVKIQPKAIKLLVERLGYEAEGFLSAGKKVDLGRLRMELQKLGSFSDGSEVTETDVESLVPLEQEAVGFAVGDALLEKNKKKLQMVLDKYFQNADSATETQKVLLLTAILAEQFRSMWVYLEAQESGVPESELLSQMGWKPGKLFALKKNTSRVSKQQVASLLAKLEHLDLEQKTSTAPPRVIAELIFSQV